MATDKLLAEWFWADRWMGSSAFLLSLEARGLYREMLTQAWRRGARLPNDPEAIRRAVGATEKEWKRAWPFVVRFWRIDGDCLVNDTQLAVYADAKGRSDRASHRGLRGAQARAQALHEQNVSTTQDVPECKPPISVSDLRSEKERTKSARFSPPLNGTTDPELGERAGNFCRRYAELYQQHRKGARYFPKPALDWPKACELCAVWPDARLEMLAVVFLKCEEPFAQSGSRTIGQFAAMASWADGRLAEVEAGGQ
jgi:uncharacterized protein YdaU (DUF1376 family)